MRNLLNLAEIDNAVNQNQMAGLQRDNLLQQMTRQKKMMADEDALNSVYNESMGADGIDGDSLVKKLIGRGLGRQAYEVQTGMTDNKLKQQRATQEAESSKLEMMVKKAKYGRDVMASVTPETWGQTRQQLIEQGFEFANNLPETYDQMAHKSSVMDADSFIKQQSIDIGQLDDGTVYNKNNPQGIELGKQYVKPEKINYNTPFMPDGTPNTAYQDYQTRIAQTTAGKPPSGYQVDPSNPNGLMPITGGPADPATKLKPLPAAISTAIVGNMQSLSKIDRAIQLLEGKDVDDMKGDKNATGLKGMLPPMLLNRIDPQGTDARADIADIGSLIIHDRSGAAVTASESPRLMPFIPVATDDQPTALKKLKRLKDAAMLENDVLTSQYSEDTGYKTGKPAQAKTAKPSAKGSAGKSKVINGVTYINDGKGWKAK